MIFQSSLRPLSKPRVAVSSCFSGGCSRLAIQDHIAAGRREETTVGYGEAQFASGLRPVMLTRSVPTAVSDLHWQYDAIFSLQSPSNFTYSCIMRMAMAAPIRWPVGGAMAQDWGRVRVFAASLPWLAGSSCYRHRMRTLSGWGYGTVALKKTKIDIPTISLTFWMIAMTTLAIGMGALLFERSAWRLPNATEWGAIIFNALVVFAFANIVWVRLARALPPVASSLSVMMIPIVGVFSGAWILGETPHWQDYAAMLLILAAMSTVLLKPRTNVTG